VSERLPGAWLLADGLNEDRWHLSVFAEQWIFVVVKLYAKEKAIFPAKLCCRKGGK